MELRNEQQEMEMWQTKEKTSGYIFTKREIMEENGTMKKDEVVVITGASAGVGRATVRAFAKRGAKIALLARGRDGLEGAKKDVEDLGSQAMILETDVANSARVEEAANLVEEEFGPIDIWVNNAMNSVFSPISKMEAEEYKRVTEVTYLGQVYGALAALKRMLPRNKGKIIFVGSALSYRGIPLQSAYCGAKHAIMGFYDSLRAELIHDESNVQVSIVHLPALNTTQFGWVKSRLPHKARPMGKIFQPEVAAEAITFAADNDRREVWVGFPTYQTIIGNKIAPGFLDWYLGQTGIKGQQTDEPEDPNRPHNLWEPLPGDHGAHGTFDEKANEDSTALWATENRGKLGIGLAVAAAVLGAAVLIKSVTD